MRCRCAVRPADRTPLRSRSRSARSRSAPRRSASPWHRARGRCRRQAVPSVRSTFTVILAAAFSAAASASGEGVPPSKIVRVRSPMVLARASTNSAPRPVSTPSVSQAISASPARFQEALERRRASRPARPHRVSARAGAARRGRRPAGMTVMSRAGSDSGTSATPRRSVSALAISSSAALIRVSQLAAALQPSSSRITSGAVFAGQPGLRIPDRAGGSEDHQRGGRAAGARSATTACATGSLPSARCRTTGASAETRSAAAAAASPATATTAPAG